MILQGAGDDFRRTRRSSIHKDGERHAVGQGFIGRREYSLIFISAQLEKYGTLIEKVIAYMQEYPSVKIDLRSHTDSRGNDSYNLALSKRRNESTRQYIVDQGIDKSRLTGNGYGETQHINQCSNGVKCSEEEHQLNRRSEFIVIEN